MTEPGASDAGAAPPGGAEFSLVIGGPFHRLLKALHLIGPDGLPTRLASLTIGLIAWLPLGVLALAQALADATYPAWVFWQDPAAHARFLLAIAVMIWTERVADLRLQRVVANFRDGAIIPDVSLGAYLHALHRADRLSSSTLAEILLLAIALLVSGIALRATIEVGGRIWEGSIADGQAVLSWAGTWTRIVSLPLFLFLLLRWLWRFGVWAQLLTRIARLPLRLVALHADDAGGLGFLTIYPTVFRGFAFAISAVVAAMFLKESGNFVITDDWVRFGLIAWLVIVLLTFIGPLFVFAPKLYELRETALLEYGRLLTQHHHAFDDRWMSAERSGRDLLGGADVSSLADINAAFDAVRSLKIVPVDRVAVISLLGAAALSMLAVIATRMPLTEFSQRVGGALP